jgi:hypothetical protein
MIERSAPLGEHDTYYLAEELAYDLAHGAVVAHLSSAPVEARASPTFPTDKDRNGHRACMTRAKGPNLWNANGRFRVSSILALSIAASTAYRLLRTRPGRDFLERERR